MNPQNPTPAAMRMLVLINNMHQASIALNKLTLDLDRIAKENEATRNEILASVKELGPERKRRKTSE